jgi:hypothetical protein
MTLKRGDNGEQVVTFGLAEKAAFGVITSLLTAGILALMGMQFRMTADIAAIKEQIKAVDRRVERVEDKQ